MSKLKLNFKTLIQLDEKESTMIKGGGAPSEACTFTMTDLPYPDPDKVSECCGDETRGPNGPSLTDCPQPNCL